ncbi:MAG: hypothetical protein JW996_04000 [Candidatus Cloacimonetes bacterium]|nr:hypothetical protein [Candidatus Cloacimonadota bacterium]
MNKDPKIFVISVLLVVFFTVTICVACIIKDARSNSFESYARGIECTAQGDLMPEPFNSEVIAPLDAAETDLFCSGQGDIKPRGWDDDDDDSNDGD